MSPMAGLSSPSRRTCASRTVGESSRWRPARLRFCLIERRDLEEQIRAAFAGVRLGAGVSLRQAAAIDVYLRGWTGERFDRLPGGEVTDDWTSIPDDGLGRDNTLEA